MSSIETSAKNSLYEVYEILRDKLVDCDVTFNVSKFNSNASISIKNNFELYVFTKIKYKGNTWNFKPVGFQYFLEQNCNVLKRSKSKSTIINAAINKVSTLVEANKEETEKEECFQHVTEILKDRLNRVVTCEKEKKGENNEIDYLKVEEVKVNEDSSILSRRGMNLYLPDTNKELFTIKDIKGKFTTNQLKRILEIVDEAEFV